MKNKLSCMVGTIILLFMMVGSLFPMATQAADSPIKPIIFVHGSAGSAAQFESQMMRFTSNGYPASYIAGFEYDSGTWPYSPSYQATTATRLDTLIADLKAQTGSDKVYLLGHSLGTFLCQTYLATPSRAATVAKYVNIDGRTAASLPGGVPTLALWATRGWSYNPANTIVGATNVFVPNQTHVQIATSSESFVEMYKFFMGSTPTTDQIVPEACGQIQLSGRAIFFPSNTGVGTGSLEIWKVNGATGERIGATPQATYALTGTGPVDGAWGPFNAENGQNYEFVIIRSGARPHHFYAEPFVRSDHLIRLLTSPTGGIGDLMERNMISSALVISRQKEFWGNDATSNDVLTINGANIINAATCPVIKVPGNTGVIGIFAYDRYLNSLTDLSAPIPTFFAVGFMTGVDIYMPAADPPNGTISLVLTPRGGGDKTQIVNALNWASLNHSISVLFNDFILTEPVSVSTDQGAAIVSCDPGTLACINTVEATSLPNTTKLLTFPYGLFSFKIVGIPVGSTVTVTITLPGPVADNTEYWKYQEGKGWYEIPIISINNRTITIKLTDGGLGDTDGVANGTIVDPGGPAIPIPTPKRSVSPTLPQLKQAQLSVQYMNVSPQQARSNEPVTISTNVVNTGDEAGSMNVALKVNGLVEQTKMISVGPQTSQPVKFTVARAQAGTYTVDIQNQQGSFVIIDQSGGATHKSNSSGLLILIGIAALVLISAVALVLSFRRSA